jgi:hypothetical protein
VNLGGWEWAILALIALLLIGGYRLGGPNADGDEPDAAASGSPASPVEPEAGASDLGQR